MVCGLISNYFEEERSSRCALMNGLRILGLRNAHVCGRVPAIAAGEALARLIVPLKELRYEKRKNILLSGLSRG